MANSRMPISNRLFTLAARWLLPLCLLVMPLVACKKNVTAPPVAGLALAPVEKTRSKLVMSATLPSVERTLTSAGALATTMQLPTSPEDLRQMVLGWLQAPQPLLDNVDIGKPLAIVMVGQEKPGADPYMAVAGHLKSTRDANQLASAIGKRTGGEKDAVEVDTGNGKRAWILTRKDVVIAAETLPALVAAGSQAVDALAAAAKEDVLVKLYVDAAMEASGKDLRAELEKVRAQAVAEAHGKGQAQTPAFDAYVAKSFDQYINWLVDTRQADFSLSLDKQDGLRLSARLHPRAGSGLAKQFSDTTPAAIDPAFLAGPLPAMLFAWNASPALKEMYVNLVGALGETDIKGAREFATAAQKVLALMTGASSGRMEIENDRLVYSAAASLAPGTKPDAAMTGLDALFKAGALPAFMSALDPKAAPAARWSRKGGNGQLTIEYPSRQETRQAREMLRSLFGSEKVAVHLTAAGDRLLGTTDPGAEKRLASLTAGQGAGPAPELEQLLAETRGDSAFGYLDLLAVARPIIAAAATQDPSAAQAGAMLNLLPGMAKLRVPLITRFRGGDSLLMQLYVPRRTFEGVGAVVGPLRGMGLGGALAPGAP